MITHKVEKRFFAECRLGNEYRMSVPTRIPLLDKLHVLHISSEGTSIRICSAGCDDYDNMFYSCVSCFGNNNLKDRFGGAITVDEALQGEGFLGGRSRCNEGAGYTHRNLAF
jgi:hypothetical protein